GVYLGTFKYLAVAVVFAPLMLFRTDFSADWGLHLYERLTDHLSAEWDRSNGIRKGLVAILTLIALPLAGTAIRVVATVYWAVRRPLQTLRDAPRNWLRQCFCTDLAHPPEIVPKEAITDNNTVIKFSSLLNDVRREERIFDKAGIISISLPFIILGWIPSLIYRVSFKATALAYTPFVFVAHATLRNPLPVKARLERVTKGELEKVRHWISGLVLTTLVAKLALIFTWVDRSYVESMFPSQRIVTNFVVLDGWPWWQITLGADAVLTFILLFFADAALARIEGERPWPEGFVMTTVASISFLRAALSIVTISHFFHIALLAAVPESVRYLLVI
ncbi:MAG: hypothetical protein QOD32_2011, partial [Pyrinomonadaceae bacterium]|nr:hypothetical protein [Pyrinomonadaceae bacterium]